jgi:hypothetical protein
MHRQVEVVRAFRRVDRVAHGDLVAHAEDRLLVAPEEAFVGGCVTVGGGVEALSARERVAVCVGVLPGAVVLDRPALELADADVVEVGVDLPVDVVAACEREPRRLLRARELGDDAEVDLDARNLPVQLPCLLDPERRQSAVEPRVAVHDVVDVEQGLPVAREEQEAHGRDRTWLGRRRSRMDWLERKPRARAGAQLE